MASDGLIIVSAGEKCQELVALTRMEDCSRYRPLLFAAGVADLGPELLYRRLADVVAESPTRQEIA